ncbi:MAG: leucine-rich repeat protein [Muribaculaceae bacterium]|nr:leucine-rich repeat protein [Muribaculaceae bacterium]
MKILRFILLAVMSLLFVKGHAQWTDPRFVVNDLYYYINDDSTTVTLTFDTYSSWDSHYAGLSGAVVIPDKVTHDGKTYGVAIIDDYTFRDCRGITSVTIPNSVTTIGAYAFSNCSGLTDITLPNSLTTIRSGAFGECSGLTNIILPNSLTSIGGYAFNCCNNLISILIPKSVTTIGDGVFGNCSRLEIIQVEEGNPKYDSRNNCQAIVETESNTLIVGCKNTAIPSTVTAIGSYAFYYCSGLTNIVLPNSLTSIGDYAFYGCSSLISLFIPKSVTPIGNGAFGGCSNIESIQVEDGNPKYDSRDNCNAIIETESNTLIAGCKTTIIPGTVTAISSNAFSRNTSLTSIDIPDSVTEITPNSFYGCTALASVIIGNSVTSIGDYAFYYCSNLKSVTLGNSVATLGVGAFYGCVSLASINLPNSLTSIGTSAFYGCSSLTTITIPNSVTNIDYYAFYECSGLTSVTLPSSVDKISSSTFYGCSSLESVRIPDSVVNIYDGVFGDCINLTLVELGGSVKDIYWNAFKGCEALETIICHNSEVTRCASSDVFDGVDRSSCVVFVPRGCKYAYMRTDVWPEFAHIVEAGSGDVNGDGEVSVADITKLVSHVLNGDSFMSSDVNGDGEVGIADITSLVGKIMNPSPDAPIVLWYLVGSNFGSRSSWRNLSNAVGDGLTPLLPKVGATFDKAYGLGTLEYTGYFVEGAQFKFVQTPGEWDPQMSFNDGVNLPDYVTCEDGYNYNVGVRDAGYYTIAVDSRTNRFTIEKANITPRVYDTITMPGGYQGWNPAANAMTEMAQTGEIHQWMALDVTFATDTELQFTNGSWDCHWGAPDFPYGKSEPNSADFVKVKAGTYNIFFNDITGTYFFQAK